MSSAIVAGGRKARVFTAIVLCLAGFAAALVAAPPSGPADKKKSEKLYKIGCIDIQDVFNAVPEKTKVQSQIEAKQKEFAGKQSQLENDLSAMVADFSNQHARMKPSEAADANIRIFNKKKELTDLVDNSNKELAELEQTLLAPIMTRLQTVIREVSVQYGFSMIIDKATYVLFVDKELDITAEVIDALKKAQKEEALDKARE